MSKLTLLVAAAALAAWTNPRAQSAAAETELAQLVADCNVMAGSRSAKQRTLRACEMLAGQDQMSLVEPAAAVAYRQYREERFQACLRRQASPRGASRPQSACEP
jgi:hypothetical protein